MLIRQNAYGQNAYGQNAYGQGQAYRPMQTNIGQYGALGNQLQGNLGSSMNQYSHSTGVVYTLRHDSVGREFICVNGRPVYFDSPNAVSSNRSLHQATQTTGGMQNQRSAGYAPYSQSQADTAVENQAATDMPQTGENSTSSAQSQQSSATSPNFNRNSDTSGSATENNSSANESDRN